MECIMKNIVSALKAFSREEDGIALTEYLILLGILTAAVITAITTSGANLSTAWDSWGTFFTGLKKV